MKRSLPALLLSFLLLLAAPLAAAPAKPPKNAPAALPAGVIGDIQLTQVRLEDIARLLSQVGQANIVVTSEVLDKVVSIYLRNARVEDMVRNVCRAAGVWYRKDSESNTYIIMSAKEYQKDIEIVRDEKTKVFTLRHHNVVATANAIGALFGPRVVLGAPVEEAPPVSLGTGTRSPASGRQSGSSGNNGNNGNSSSGNNRSGSGSSGNNSGGGQGGGFSGGGFTGGFGGGQGGARGGGGTVSDPRADMGRVSTESIANQLQFDERGMPIASSGSLQDLSSRLGQPIYVTYNRLNNLLLVRTGDLDAIEQIDALIARMDRPPQQVLLEMQILEVTLDDGFRSIFDIGAGSRRSTTGPGGWGTTDPLPPGGSPMPRNSLGTGLFGIDDNANMIWQVMSNTLSLRLQLLASENKLKVLSSPMLVAANNQLARLFIGDERVLTVGASSQSVTGTTGATNTTITVETEKRDVGHTLAILPRINTDGTVSLTVDQDSSSVKIGDATIPISTASGDVIYFPIDTVSTASLQATAHAKDGMTVAIGGMIRETVIRDEEKVPVVGDVPVLGFFFKRDVRATIRSQLVLLVTPRIIATPEEGERIAAGKAREFNADAATFPQTPTLPKLKLDIPAAAESMPVPDQR